MLSNLLMTSNPGNSIIVSGQGDLVALTVREIADSMSFLISLQACLIKASSFLSE